MSDRKKAILDLVGEIYDEGKAILADRAATHGDLGLSYHMVAALWSARLGVTVRPSDVAFCLGDVKYVRHRFNPNHHDNGVDGVNYAAIGFATDDSGDGSGRGKAVDARRSPGR